MYLTRRILVIAHTESTENLIAMRIVRIERIFICPAEMAEIAEILFALNVFLSH